MDGSDELVSRPLFYLNMLGLLTAKAKELGYNLAIHGSLNRDFDLIAVPWVEEARSEWRLVYELAKACGGRIPDSTPEFPNPERKPHGRMAWSIFVTEKLYLDVSVIQRIKPAAEPPVL